MSYESLEDGELTALVRWYLTLTVDDYVTREIDKAVIEGLMAEAVTRGLVTEALEARGARA